MLDSPLAAALSAGTRSLGAHLCSRARPHEPLPTAPLYTANAIRACVEGTYKKCRQSTHDRMRKLKEANISLASRAVAVNTFVVSTVPYAATIAPISTKIGKELRSEVTTLFSTRGWIAQSMVYDLGPLLELKGSPKDPVLIAWTSSVTTGKKGGLAGPSTLARPITQLTEMLRRHARTLRASTGNEAHVQWNPGDPIFPFYLTLKAARAFKDHDPHVDNAPLDDDFTGRSLSQAIYLLLFSSWRRQNACNYLAHRSRTRRWRPTSGEEFILSDYWRSSKRPSREMNQEWKGSTEFTSRSNNQESEAPNSAARWLTPRSPGNSRLRTGQVKVQQERREDGEGMSPLTDRPWNQLRRQRPYDR